MSPATAAPPPSPPSPPPPPQFAAELRAALEHRGLSLTALRSRLRSRGVAVSLTTLSYWQRGERVPRGPASLEAVEAIETILGLDDGQLTGAIRERRPGRPAALTTYTEFDDTPPVIDEALDELGLLRDFGLEEVSAHVVVSVDGGGQVVAARNRQVLRSVRDGARSLPAVLLDDFPLAEPPRIDAVRGCAVGRRIDRPEHAASVVEIVLNTALPYGASAVIETELHFPPHHPRQSSATFGYHLTRRLQECVLWVQFQPGVLPEHGEAHTQIAGQDRRAVPSTFGHDDLCAVVHGFGPGRLWLEWEW